MRIEIDINDLRVSLLCLLSEWTGDHFMSATVDLDDILFNIIKEADNKQDITIPTPDSITVPYHPYTPNYYKIGDAPPNPIPTWQEYKSTFSTNNKQDL